MFLKKLVKTKPNQNSGLRVIYNPVAEITKFN